jgi:transposase InsO family protein/transposase
MKLHANARLSVKGRELLVDRATRQGWSLAQAAEAAGVSDRTAGKWVARFRLEGVQGLLDRSSAPRSSPSRTPEERVQAIAALRRLRMTGAEIAECLNMAGTTVSGILTKIGMGKLGRLGLEPAARYERERPGELVHIDVKKLGRIHAGAGHRVTGKRGRYTGMRTDAEGTRRQIVGWEFVHIAIDDATRLAYVEVLPDEKAITAIAFLRRAAAFYASHGITVERLLTDNGSAYRSSVHAIACRALRIKHLRTRPYRPQTNGKAERFIRTMLGGWAYGAIYRDSTERTAALPGWLELYNWRRPHGALNHKPPGTRLHELNNLLGSYSYESCSSCCTARRSRSRRSARPTRSGATPSARLWAAQKALSSFWAAYRLAGAAPAGRTTPGGNARAPCGETLRRPLHS